VRRVVSVRFQPLSSAPVLKQRVFKISASSKFSVVTNFLRKKLSLKPSDGLFCYVNSVFAPGLDEGVGGLWRVSAKPLPVRLVLEERDGDGEERGKGNGRGLDEC
jgi:hypothetical protein